MKEILTNIQELLGLAFWVEIITENPRCTYYFGPFASQKEAQGASSGYIEDLQNEGAVNIAVKVERMKPTELTIFDDLGETSDRERFPTLSGQLS